MIITDTHTHLYSEEFAQDRDTVIKNAIAAGVTRFFLPAIEAASFDAMLEVEQKYPDHMFLMTGLHPTYVKENYKEELDFVASSLKKRSFVAIGEIGMDLYWDKTFIEQQKEAFAYQIQLAKQYDLPIVIHCRDAFDAVFEVLQAHKSENLRGVFHCFTGTLDQAKKAISYNMALGIGGVVTFKNGKIDRFLDQIPLEHIVLETDAPYLAPVPYRGKRNQSLYIVSVLEKMATIYQKTPQEIAAITTMNSKTIFGI